MSRYRNAALAVGAWLLVVTGGAVLVWTVISQAGEGVAGAPPAVQAGSAEPSRRPSGSPSSTGGGTPSADPTSAAEAVRGTWSGTGGVVIAACTGGDIALVGTYPASGWKYEIDERGPSSVRVEFETSDERTRVRVEGACAAGEPSFSEDTRSKG